MLELKRGTSYNKGFMKKILKIIDFFRFKFSNFHNLWL